MMKGLKIYQKPPILNTVRGILRTSYLMVKHRRFLFIAYDKNNINPMEIHNLHPKLIMAYCENLHQQISESWNEIVSQQATFDEMKDILYGTDPTDRFSDQE